MGHSFLTPQPWLDPNNSNEKLPLSQQQYLNKIPMHNLIVFSFLIHVLAIHEKKINICKYCYMFYASKQ
jgi:hypothetical protein